MKAHSNFIQVRAGTGSEKNKVYAKGYASIPNKLDLYNYMKLPDGKTRTFKSLFTSSCIEDMKKQLETKAVFVDGMHEIATNLGILNLAKKYNFSDEDLNDVEAHLKQKRLPLAKVVDFDIDENGLIIGTETNPYFAKVDDEHKSYYEAVTGSLLDGYLKGFSINFEPVEFKTEMDEKGNQIDYINKIDLFGISYHDSPALPDNQFTDVCMRSLGNFMKVRTMTEQNEKKEEQVEPQQPQPKQEEKIDIEAQIQKRVDEILAKKEQANEQQEMKKQLEEQKKLIEELKKKAEPQQPQEVTTPQKQSTVQPEDKYGNQVDAQPQEITEDQVKQAAEEMAKPLKDYLDRISRPTAKDELGVRQDYRGVPYDKYGELLYLQSEAATHKRMRPGESYNDYMRRQSLLNDNRADMSVKHTARV